MYFIIYSLSHLTARIICNISYRVYPLFCSTRSYCKSYIIILQTEMAKVINNFVCYLFQICKSSYTSIITSHISSSRSYHSIFKFFNQIMNIFLNCLIKPHIRVHCWGKHLLSCIGTCYRSNSVIAYTICYF